MMRNAHQRWAVVILFLSALGLHAAPNIVLIIADDLGVEDCGPYGSKTIRTPNLDRLAKEGMRFDRAFLTCSSCSPSRASLITGRYPHNTGAEQLHWPVPADQVTFVERLRDVGYWTCAAGKWHLGNPLKKRFDVVNDTMGGASGCERWVPTLKARPMDKPFFAWLAAFDPHRDYQAKIIDPPHRADDMFVPPYLPDVVETREDLARYADEITRLDRFIGQVLEELERQGIAENTLVLFMTDNGRPFPRCKTTVYDSGIRTPLLARWPKVIAPGSLSPRLVSSIDIGPTLMELANAKAGPMFQGRSFAGLFREPNQRSRDHVFAEHNWHDFEARSRAVRSERYKLIVNEYTDLPNTPPADAVRSPTFQAMRRLRDAGKLTDAQRAVFTKPLPAEELYDCDADPHELRNRIDDPMLQSVRDELRATLKQWRVDTNDQAPKQRTPDEFDRETGERIGEPRKGPRLPKE